MSELTHAITQLAQVLSPVGVLATVIIAILKSKKSGKTMETSRITLEAMTDKAIEQEAEIKELKARLAEKETSKENVE